MLLLGPIRTVTVLDVAGNGKTRHVAGHQGGTIALAFSQDGTRLVSGGRQGDAKVWDTARWTELCAYHGHDGEITALAISPDGRLAASAHEPKEITDARFGRAPLTPIPPTDVHVWDASNGAERFKLAGHHGVGRLAFSSDGRWLASAAGQIVKFWDLETGTLLRELDAKQLRGGANDALAFSPSGKFLITAGGGIVQLWDAAERRPAVEIRGHASNRIDGLAFSPDETRLATACVREVKLWDVRTGQEILTLPLSQLREIESAPVAALSWTSDGHRLRSALRDGSVVEWRDE
jgi:WD40 repeat protein